MSDKSRGSVGYWRAVGELYTVAECFAGQRLRDVQGTRYDLRRLMMVFEAVSHKASMKR